MRHAIGSTPPHSSGGAAAQAAAHPEDLTSAMLHGSAQAHRRTEENAFMQELRAGTLPRRAFVQYLTDLREMYAALEDGLQTLRAQGRIGETLFPDTLRRTGPLGLDLTQLAVRGRPVHPSVPALHYAGDLRLLAQTAPMSLLAHAYVLYMGDLAGGQIIKRWVRKAYPEDFPRGVQGGADAGAGVAGAAEAGAAAADPAAGLAPRFYDFSALLREGGHASAQDCRRAWKAAPDALPLNDAQKDDCVGQARAAFACVQEILSACRELAAAEPPEDPDWRSSAGAGLSGSGPARRSAPPARTAPEY
ncbi:MAG: biliverdin-producing heme oxygenase [Candidatus Protistobacter heckmanni]|nr:biliverdin-producing heme oxygenase [Candidatus Protistobacter heckmanni]